MVFVKLTTSPNVHEFPDDFTALEIRSELGIKERIAVVPSNRQCGFPVFPLQDQSTLFPSYSRFGGEFPEQASVKVGSNITTSMDNEATGRITPNQSENGLTPSVTPTKPNQTDKRTISERSAGNHAINNIYADSKNLLFTLAPLILPPHLTRAHLAKASGIMFAYEWKCTLCKNWYGCETGRCPLCYLDKPNLFLENMSATDQMDQSKLKGRLITSIFKGTKLTERVPQVNDDLLIQFLGRYQNPVSLQNLLRQGPNHLENRLLSYFTYTSEGNV